jgi:hypothetical protein
VLPGQLGMNSTHGSTPPNPNLDLPNRSTDLNKTLRIIGTPHAESIAKFNPTKICPKRRNRRTRKTPKSSPFTHGFQRRITAQRTMKGSRKFPPSNPQEKGPENSPRKTPRKGSENHHQEQLGTPQQGFEEPPRIIYTCHKGSIQGLACHPIIQPSHKISP